MALYHSDCAEHTYSTLEFPEDSATLAGAVSIINEQIIHVNKRTMMVLYLSPDQTDLYIYC